MPYPKTASHFSCKSKDVNNENMRGEVLSAKTHACLLSTETQGFDVSRKGLS